MNDAELARQFQDWQRDQANEAVREARRRELAQILAEARGSTIEADQAAVFLRPASTWTRAETAAFERLHNLSN